MKFFGKIFLSFAAPLLILVAFLGFLQRDGNDRLLSIPAFCVGIGLIISGPLGRLNRRKKLLISLRDTSDESN